MVGLPGWVGVRDLEPGAGVEGHGGVQVRHDKVDLVRFRASHEEPPCLHHLKHRRLRISGSRGQHLRVDVTHGEHLGTRPPAAYMKSGHDLVPATRSGQFAGPEPDPAATYARTA